jgi:hypothetical protein
MRYSNGPIAGCGSGGHIRQWSGRICDDLGLDFPQNLYDECGIRAKIIGNQLNRFRLAFSEFGSHLPKAIVAFPNTANFGFEPLKKTGYRRVFHGGRPVIILRALIFQPYCTGPGRVCAVVLTNPDGSSSGLRLQREADPFLSRLLLDPEQILSVWLLGA